MDFKQNPGGTLHLSPSHIHTMDSVSNYHIRRGLSRSPSTSRLHPQFTSARPTALSSSLGPAISVNRTPASSQLSNMADQDITLDLFPPSTVKKIHRPRYTRATPLRMMSHTPSKTPSKTPLRRALSDANDQGNCPSIVNVMGYRGHGQENSSSPDGSPAGPAGTPFVKIDQSRSPFNLSLTPSRDNIARPARFSKSSPMKRGDGNVLLDRSHLGSPAGKRKAITGGFDSSSPFDISSNSDRMMLDAGADRAGNDSDDEAASNDVVGTPPPAMRSFNLRRSSRIAESRPHIRSRYSVDANVDSRSPRTHGRTRARASLDSGLPIAMFGHKDPFKTDDTFSPVHNSTTTTNSALSPIAPSPIHDAQTKKNDDALFQRPALPRIDFTKSLPIGAIRPKPRSFRGIQNLVTEERGVATPEAFKNVKPNPVPFMSTGLISKRHRNPDDMPAPPGRPGMPDTPCKKLPPGFSFETSPVATRPSSKLHFPQPSFGTPSKPYSIHSNKGTPFGKTGSVFGSSFTPKNSDLQRRASFASIHSIDGEEAYHSPLTLTQVDSQSSADELPPTPTKGASRTESKPSSLRSKLFGREGRRPTVSTNTFLPPSAIEQQASNPSRKSIPAQGVFSSAPSTPEIAESPSFLSPGGRISAMCSARRRMQLKPLVATLQSSSMRRIQGSSCLNPNPLYIAKTPYPLPVFTTFPNSGGGMSPKTPAEGTFNFPDPSSLSISPRPPNPSTPFLAPGQHHGSQHPETPTHRDSEVNAQLMSLTPSNHAAGHDVDPDLVARFRKVEWYGRGEFSEVYKVSELADKQGYFSSSLGSRSSQMSLPEKVWIVKKTRTPFTSTKAMQKKLREVHAMQEIGRSEQIVQLINHWNANHHLYIQLEFCEEGSLEDFLAKAGLRGRLDDFRIWKVLVDLCDVSNLLLLSLEQY